jgi:nucleotide-binding universal stress UspA family protein
VATTDPTLQQRVVAGVDGSTSSIEALQWAARQAHLTGATLEVITTWDWPRNWGWMTPLPENYDPEADARAVLDSAIEPMRSAYPDIEIQTRAIEGHPAPALVAASRDADLLVVGSRGHGAFRGMLLGSVSEHCVTNAHCPVTVVRERLGSNDPEPGSIDEESTR